MVTSQSLVLFSAWAGDDSESTRAWLRSYRDHLDTHYPDLPKIVAINAGSHPVAEELLNGLKGAVAIVHVTPEFDIGSDASGYQLVWRVARDLQLQPDAVLFLHTKGVSHDFSMHGSLLDHLRHTVVDRDLVGGSLSAGAGLVTSSGYLLQGPGGIAEARRFAEALGCPPPLAVGAGASIYWWSGDVFSRALARLPPAFFATPLAEQGFNRFFFESVAPSLAISLGAEPVFLGGANVRTDLNAYCSYHQEHQHNSALVLQQWRNWKTSPHDYRQQPTPYIFGDPDDIKVAFEM